MKEEALMHPLHIDNRTPEEIQNNEPFPVAKVIGFGKSSFTLRVWAWTDNTEDGFVMYSDLLQSLKKRFDAENIVVQY